MIVKKEVVKREFLGFLGFVLILLVCFLFIYFFNETLKYTGKVVFVGEKEVWACDTEKIRSFWQGIFKEEYSSSSFYNHSLEGCKKWIAVKIKENREFFYISFEINESLAKVEAVFGNLSEDYYNEIKSFNNYENFSLVPTKIRENITKTKTEVKNDINEANQKFKEIFGVEFEGFERLESGRYVLTKENESDEYKSKTEYFSYQNNSFYGISEILNLKERFWIYQKETIPNETIFINSSWEEVINLDNYFYTRERVNYFIVFLGNNSNGEWINATISSNKVKFKPKEGFSGEREFKIIASYNYKINVSSNIFKIKVERKNTPPKFIGQIGPLFIKKGQIVSFNLDSFFEDEEDELKYSYEKGEKLNIKIEKNKINISLKENFEDKDFFYIIANDSVYTRKSNKIDVFLDIEKEYFEPKNQTINETREEQKNNTIENKSIENAEKKKSALKKEVIYWVFGIFGFLILLTGVLLIIYFIVLKKEKTKEKIISNEEVLNKKIIEDYINKVQ